MNFHDFKFKVGEIVIFCQIIEANIKIIYVNLVGKNKQATWNQIEKDSLGTICKKLETLDKNNKLLTNEDYYYLHLVAGIRNHWCHQAFINFLYSSNDFENTQQYKNECIKLIQDHSKLSRLYKLLEDLRIKVVKKSL